MEFPSVNGESDDSMDGGQSLCEHLRSLEASLLDPAVRRNREKVASLLRDDFLEFGSSGRVWSRDEILDLLETESYEQPAMQDFDCRELASEVALVTYRAIRVDASQRTHTATLRSSLWIQEAGEWRMGFHQGTRVLVP